MMPESLQFNALVHRKMRETGYNYDDARAVVKEEAPALWAAIQGGKPVALGNTEGAARGELAAKDKKDKAVKLFYANVRAVEEAEGVPYEIAYGRAREQYVTLSNTATTPIFGANRALLGMPPIATQEECVVAYESNGKQFSSRDSQAIWRALVAYQTARMVGQGADKVVDFMIHRYPQLAREAGIIAAQ